MQTVAQLTRYRLPQLLLLLWLSACSSVQEFPESPYQASLAPATSGVPATVSQTFEQQQLTDRPANSGIHLLAANHEALAIRLALVDQAVSSIDMQYFIWHSDTAGRLLFYRIYQAAERGVRVRLLIDDMDLETSDTQLATFSEHPNIEIRLFNPTKAQHAAGKLGEWAINFHQLNRRMHNKLMVVDGQMAIMGGRNIGNHYYGLEPEYNFIDLDVLVTGAVLPELSLAFDKYWNSVLSIPTEYLTEERIPGGYQQLFSDRAEFVEQSRPRWVAYRSTPQQSRERLLALEQQLIPANAVVLQEQPAELEEEEYRLADLLRHLLKPTQQELIYASPYLIPKETRRLDNLKQMIDNGIETRLLTNSLGSNDHTFVHSHYRKFRYDLMDTGLQLYEFRHDPSPAVREMATVEPTTGGFISLHAKAIVSDRKLCFLGSLNLDPRAIEINTENGLLISSPAFCGQLAAVLLQLMEPQNSWRVIYDEQQRVRWSGPDGLMRTTQPSRSLGTRISDILFRILPIEDQL